MIAAVVIGIVAAVTVEIAVGAYAGEPDGLMDSNMDDDVVTDGLLTAVAAVLTVVIVVVAAKAGDDVVATADADDVNDRK